MALRCGGGLTVERGAGGSLGIDGVALASSAAGLTVRAVDVHDLDPLAGEVPGEPGAVAAGALHPDTDKFTVAAHPAEQLPVAGCRRLERRDVVYAAGLVDHRGDMKVLVGVDAAVDAGLRFGHAGVCLPSSRRWG